MTNEQLISDIQTMRNRVAAELADLEKCCSKLIAMRQEVDVLMAQLGQTLDSLTTLGDSVAQVLRDRGDFDAADWWKSGGE